MSVLNHESELHYMINWFNEFTEYEKQDFLPVLVDFIVKDGVYMNGVLSSLAQNNINDKPLSLFQCRLKLFKEWSPKWSAETRQKLVEKVNEIDELFGEKVQSEVSSVLSVQSNGSLGQSTISDVFPTPDVLDDNDANEQILADFASGAVAGQLIDVNSN